MTRLLAGRVVVLVALSIVLSGAAVAAIARHEASRFDAKVLYDPVAALGIVAETPEEIDDLDEGRQGWSAFKAAHGGEWQVRLDRRSGAPILAQGPGIPWFDPDGPAPSIEQLEARARAFVGENAVLFRVHGSQLVLNRAASAMWDSDRGLIAFDRVVDGVPVEGQRLALFVVRGRLVAFGADRWGTLERAPRAVYGVETARELLRQYAGIHPGDRVDEIESGTLVLIPSAPAPHAETRWRGAAGRGLAYRLVHRFALRVAGEPGAWVGKVDAVSGEIVAFYDDEKYAQVRGGIYPVASDGDCARGGCERDNFPMPYADLAVNGTPLTTNEQGIFECSGGSASTSLIGPYVRINDNCGPVSEAVACDENLDLFSGPAGQTNCSVNAGESAGNTHASRTAFYTVNRIKEKGRYWLPANGWLQNQVQVNVNVNSTCNATWGGQLNMYRAGGGCRNTAETAGVLNHEYGHGLDQNDGGGYDNTSEAYADVVAILSDRASCVGRGFFESQTCSAYGDTCLTCTGIRDMDWAARAGNTPTTPANFTSDNCGGGSGPCGKETHCESYPPSEAVYDLAARDLPASGLDAISAWQLTEKLFYKSRNGSTGNIFNCSLPNSDGCNANGWYNTMRIADDDDGNLSNGTPHAAAIYAAFARHNIACGTAADNANKNSSACPALQVPAVSALNGSGSVTLSWNAVPNAGRYLILRTEISCDFTQNVIATVPAPATSYVDTDLPNGFTFFYRIQAEGSNTACASPVSACVQGTPQPFAGTIKLDKPAYSCSSPIQVTVLDANVGGGTATVQIFSSIETAAETIVLTETPAGSSKFIGAIQATAGAPAAGDVQLAIADGVGITVRYTDTDDGQGGSNLLRTATALGDCRTPQISAIQVSGVTDARADVTWLTDEPSSSVVRWGGTLPPAATASASGLTPAHTVALTGLSACTVYYFAVESQDAPGNLAQDERSGQYYAFETLGNFGQGLQPCRSGKATLARATVGCSESLQIRVVDLDLNTDTQTAQTIDVTVTSSTETTPEVVTLTETAPNSAIFTGSIATSPAAPLAGNGILETRGGDLLTATYQDASDATGAGAVSFATATADCAAPEFSGVRVTDVTDESAIVRWETSEPGTSRVEWGTTPALGFVAENATLDNAHAVTLSPLLECGRLYFRVSSTDVYGNTRVFDASGAPFAFNAYRIPGIFRDEFEAGAGWTLEGEWQIGAPQGRGSSPGDPTVSFQGTQVLGLDLTGLGAKPGDYEVQSNTRAYTATINAASLSGGQLKFRRWLNVGGGGIAFVEVRKNGTWNTVWNSNSVTGLSESAWSLQSINISAFADANAALQVAFRVFAGPGQASPRAGWNVDRMVIKSASQPDFDVCGSCAGAPTFAGLATATDLSACADSGIRLSWDGAPAWGTGPAGTYAVYRSTDAAFVPSPANRIAAGIAATSYIDAGAPNDQTLHYVVRAENGEACSTGPNNGGVTDANLVRVSARDESTQPAPGTAGDSVIATVINDAHVRLTWTASPTAATYRVLRAQLPAGPFEQVAEVTGTVWEDGDQLADSASRYYRIRAADSCGNEGP